MFSNMLRCFCYCQFSLLWVFWVLFFFSCWEIQCFREGLFSHLQLSLMRSRENGDRNRCLKTISEVIYQVLRTPVPISAEAEVVKLWLYAISGLQDWPHPEPLRPNCAATSPTCSAGPLLTAKLPAMTCLIYAIAACMCY